MLRHDESQGTLPGTVSYWPPAVPEIMTPTMVACHGLQAKAS
ncbi:hypothetical protein PRUB_a2231 [Pseudoalteromonas rubra]|uniref:Uncharacterized protein n=1 Tax=Pseudoalteromonas rubra TaxID=43658 RepID=A0A8T0CAY8_9GAMM|nr:hypothetical protein PRUB_a2231 [Pseudoalteromonas rubra]